MSNELFRQRELLTAAKLNRLLTRVRSTEVVSDELDGFGDAVGTILVRETDGWEALGPGAVGDFLTVGADSVPEWTGLEISDVSGLQSELDGLNAGTLNLSWSGAVVDASKEIGRAAPSFTMLIAAGTYNFDAVSGIAPTSNTTYTLYKDDGASPVSIGSAVFGAADKGCAVTVSATTIPGYTHAITAVGPVAPDATHADFIIPVPYTRG